MSFKKQYPSPNSKTQVFYIIWILWLKSKWVQMTNQIRDRKGLAILPIKDCALMLFRYHHLKDYTKITSYSSGYN